MHCHPSGSSLYFCSFAMNQLPHFVHNTELAMTLLPQTPHGPVLLLNSLPSDPLTINFLFLMLTFKFLLPSASFQFQNLSFKLSMSSLAHLEQPKFPITANLLIFAQYRIFALGINLKAFLFSKVNYFRMPIS